MNSFGPQKPPVQGTFCTQPNGEQGVINDRGQCVAQAPLFAPSTMHLYNINNVPNPEADLDSGRYGKNALDYIRNVTGVDMSGGVMPNGSLSGWDQGAMMDKSRQEVERAFQLYLGREADSGGLSYYSDRVMDAALHKNATAIKDVMEEIKNSPEGKAYAASQSSASTEPTGPEINATSYCDGTTFVLDYGNGTIDRLENNINCGGTGSTTDDDTTGDDSAGGNLAAGTFLGKQCSGTTMITLTADGEGGSVQSAAPNSAECGYSAPPPPPPAPAPVDLGDYSTYTSPVTAGVGTVTGNAGGSGVGAVTGYTYSPYQMQQASELTQRSSGQTVDYVKMLQGWLTNSLFQDII